MNVKIRLVAALGSILVLVVTVLLALPAHAGPGEQNFLVTEKLYTLPEVTLVDSAGEPVGFPGVTDIAERTVISFIFTSCAGICPMITANMARAVPELDEMGDDYQILLISVDPEYDTPARLAEYAERFRTGAKIRFLTGDRENVFQVLRSVEALYEGSNKMNHQPVTLISSSETGDWIRIDGLIGSEVLIEQYRKVVARQSG
jgi:protein SCO1/2